MAYTPCSASAVAANAVKNCQHPAFEGLKVMALAVAKNNIASVVRGASQETKNQVTAITLKDGAKWFAIEAGGETAWADTAHEFDASTKRWNKTASFIAPAQGAEFAAQVVEPMMKDPDGFVIILQRKNNNGDMSYPIIGLEVGAVGSSNTLNYTDNASAGADVLTLVETGAPSAEIDLWVTDQETTDALFATYVAATL